MSEIENKITRQFIKWLCEKAGNGYVFDDFYSGGRFYYVKAVVSVDVKELSKIWMPGFEIKDGIFSSLLFRDLLQRARQGINHQYKYRINIYDDFYIEVITFDGDDTAKYFSINPFDSNEVYKITPEEKALIDALYFIMEKEERENDNN